MYQPFIKVFTFSKFEKYTKIFFPKFNQTTITFCYYCYIVTLSNPKYYEGVANVRILAWYFSSDGLNFCTALVAQPWEDHLLYADLSLAIDLLWSAEQ